MFFLFEIMKKHFNTIYHNITNSHQLKINHLIINNFFIEILRHLEDKIYQTVFDSIKLRIEITYISI